MQLRNRKINKTYFGPGLTSLLKKIFHFNTMQVLLTIILTFLEVVRTRLREDGTKYTKFWQTTKTIYSEEGVRGLYRGLLTQLVRQVPNTAIMMVTYEAMVYFLTKNCQNLANSGRNATQFYTEPKRKGQWT